VDDSSRREEADARRRGSGGLAFLPAFGFAGISTAVKRVGIGALIVVAIGGMGRQFVLEQRADNLVHTIELRDIQLQRYANSGKWGFTASNLRGEIGRRLQVLCPPGGLPRTIWGSGVYTDDSGICTAGVHSGVITTEDGGVVTIEVRPGQSEYQGTYQNGIESYPFGRWHGSFVIVPSDQDRRVLGLADMYAGTTSWDASAIELRGLNGTMVSFSCPGNGQDRGPIWGTDVYTDDSSICTAAVHAGVITFRDGGEVTIELVPGQAKYDGTTRNGVASLDHPDWSGSFVFVPQEPRYVRPNPQPRPSPTPRPRVTVDLNPTVVVGLDPDYRLRQSLPAPAAEIGWRTTAVELGSWDGFRAELTCPAGGTAAPVWGSDTYTDGSSICTAAVHAGLITFEDGGRVTIEILPGLSSYEGTNRNGVHTSAVTTSGEWRGSFGFVRR
jgi:phage baseplate assembly protein gpV